MRLPSTNTILSTMPKLYLLIIELSISERSGNRLYSDLTTFFKDVYFHSSSLVVGNPF